MALIMIVDDEKDIRETTKSLLEREGYKVVIAQNVDDCVKKIDKEKPDLILLDLLMPGTLVNELTDRIGNIKVLIFSVAQSNDLKELIEDPKLNEFLKLPNIVGHIHKPFDNNKFIATVKTALEKSL